MSPRAVKASLLSFLSLSQPFGGRRREAGRLSSLEAFAPCNGCGSLLGVSLSVRLINRDFLSAAANAADLPSGGSAAAEEACAGAVRTEAEGMVPSGPGGAQYHRERNPLLRHWGCLLHTPD